MFIVVIGLVGGAHVEAPKVDANGTIIGWNVIYARNRKYAVDMAGFAINLDLIVHTRAIFGAFCKKRWAPETCFLEQFKLKLHELEPFGIIVNDGNNDTSTPIRDDILVWHTKTKSETYKGDKYGYFVE